MVILITDPLFATCGSGDPGEAMIIMATARMNPHVTAADAMRLAMIPPFVVRQRIKVNHRGHLRKQPRTMDNDSSGNS